MVRTLWFLTVTIHNAISEHITITYISRLSDTIYLIMLYPILIYYNIYSHCVLLSASIIVNIPIVMRYYCAMQFV